MMDHEKLDVYSAARDFTVFTRELLARGVSRGRPDLAEQLQCASASISLNIAEGAGEFAAKEKARFYRIARRSATECAAILDQLVDWSLLKDEETRAGKELLERMVSMLIRLARTQEALAPKESRTPMKVRTKPVS
jgi:four helix bundle protein